MRFMGMSIYVTGEHDDEFRVHLESAVVVSDGKDLFEILNPTEISLLEDCIGIDLYEENPR